MSVTRREWLEEVAGQAIDFDRVMQQTIAAGAYGKLGPHFDRAQAQLRQAVKRLDPVRATDARLERISELVAEMLEARRNDGPQAFLYNDVASVLMKIRKLSDQAPKKPELSDIEEPTPLVIPLARDRNSLLTRPTGSE